MVAYIASHSPLPPVPWHQREPAFHVIELKDEEDAVRRHLALPHVCYAGSHTGCGCGFNEGREYPEFYEDLAAAQAGALESASRLARYVREHRVEQIYSCWSGEEDQPKEFERHIKPEELAAPDFFLRQRELLIVAHDAAESA